MNKELFDQYLREYVREALIYGDQDVDEAANYLFNQRKPGFFSKKEKKQALERAQKIFSAYRDRPLWFIMKCIGLDLDDLSI
jgi:hypothetical protein